MSNVNHPAHYQNARFEVIEVIEAFFADNYHRGTAVKYLCRAGKKDPSRETEDLEKAVWYINREMRT